MKQTFSQFKEALGRLKVNQTCLVATPEAPTNDKIENYNSLIKLIQTHTNLKYKLEVVEKGMRIKRIN